MGGGGVKGGGGGGWRGVGRWIWWFTVGVGWALKLNQLAPGAGGPFTSRQGEVSTERGLRRGVERAVLGARASRRRVSDVGWVGRGWWSWVVRAPQIKPSRIGSRRLIRLTVRLLDVLPCSRTDTTHLVVRAGRPPFSA